MEVADADEVDQRDAIDPEPVRTAWPASQAGLYGALGELIPDFLACVPDDPEVVAVLRGELVLTVTVVEDDGVGRVSQIDVNALEEHDSSVSDCMMAPVLDIAFDAPTDGPFQGTIEIEYGFD